MAYLEGERKLFCTQAIIEQLMNHNPSPIYCPWPHSDATVEPGVLGMDCVTGSWYHEIYTLCFEQAQLLWHVSNKGAMN